MQGKTEKEKEKKRGRKQDHREESAGEKGFGFLDPDLKLRRPQQQKRLTSPAPSLCLDFPYLIKSLIPHLGPVTVPKPRSPSIPPCPSKVWKHTKSFILLQTLFSLFSSSPLFMVCPHFSSSSSSEGNPQPPLSLCPHNVAPSSWVYI